MCGERYVRRTVTISFKEAPELERSQVLALYRSCGWGSAEKPDQLMAALDGAHRVLTAWYEKRLIGLVYSISDGALVVYYPHLLVHPEYQGRGIGASLLSRMSKLYSGFHQQILLAYEQAEGFYARCGFARPEGITPFWIYPSESSDVSGSSP